MAADGMTVRLHLKRFKVVRVVTDEIDELVIEVAGTRTVLRCPACGHKTKTVHETRRVLVRDVPLGPPTTLIWLQRRFECDNCGGVTLRTTLRSRASSPAAWPASWCATRST